MRRLTVPRSQFACNPGVATRAVSKANGIRCCEAWSRPSGSFFADIELCQQCLRSTSDSRPGCIHAYGLAYNLALSTSGFDSDIAKPEPGGVPGLFEDAWTRRRLAFRGSAWRSVGQSRELGGLLCVQHGVRAAARDSSTASEVFSQPLINVRASETAGKAHKPLSGQGGRTAAIEPQRCPKT